MIPGGLLALAVRHLDDPPDRARIERAIADVLARAEFQPPEKNAWDRFKEWLFETLLGAVRDLVGGIDLDSAWGMAIFAFLVLSLVAILAHLVYTVLQVVPRRAAAAAAPGAQALPGGGLAQALAAARELAAAGRLAEAMHALYRATLLWLDERGQARFDPSKTAGDYRRELSPPELRRGFAAMVEAFDPVAWGGRAPRRDSWERMRSAASTLGVPA